MVLAFILYTSVSLAFAGLNEQKQESVTLTIIESEIGKFYKDQSQGLWSGHQIEFQATPEITDNGNNTATVGQETSTSVENSGNETGSSTTSNQTDSEVSGNNSTSGQSESVGSSETNETWTATPINDTGSEGNNENSTSGQNESTETSGTNETGSSTTSNETAPGTIDNNSTSGQNDSGSTPEGKPSNTSDTIDDDKDTSDDDKDTSEANSTNNNENTSNNTSNNSSGDSNTSATDPDEIQCPAFYCSSTPDDDCLDEENGAYTLHPCKSDQICSFSYSNLSSSECVPAPTMRKYEVKTRGNSTTNCSITQDCKSGWYCANSTCKHVRTEDSFCSGLEACEKGTICNQGRCVEYFSVKSGRKADYSIACESGILLSGFCQAAELTVGELPKKCKKHEDCTASNGKDGICACVFDEKSSKYCKLHRSDQISLKHLEYAHQDNEYQAEYYTLLYNVYPVNLFVDECFRNSSKELIDLENAYENAELESAVGLQVLGLVLWTLW